MGGTPARSRRVYVDTSVWVAVLTQEPSTETLMRALEAEAGQLLTAIWTRTELASALGIKARRKELTQDRVRQLIQEFELWVAGGLTALPVDSMDFLLAARLCENIDTELRGGDALHLSVAKRCRATHLMSLDKDMLENASSLGMQLIDYDDNKKLTH